MNTEERTDTPQPEAQNNTEEAAEPKRRRRKQPAWMQGAGNSEHIGRAVENDGPENPEPAKFSSDDLAILALKAKIEDQIRSFDESRTEQEKEKSTKLTIAILFTIAGLGLIAVLCDMEKNRVTQANETARACINAGGTVIESNCVGNPEAARR